MTKKCTTVKLLNKLISRANEYNHITSILWAIFWRLWLLPVRANKPLIFTCPFSAVSLMISSVTTISSIYKKRPFLSCAVSFELKKRYALFSVSYEERQLCLSSLPSSTSSSTWDNLWIIPPKLKFNNESPRVNFRLTCFMVSEQPFSINGGAQEFINWLNPHNLSEIVVSD